MVMTLQENCQINARIKLMIITAANGLLLNLEDLYIQNYALQDRVTIMQRVLESLITDPPVKQNYQNMLYNWKNAYEPQIMSFSKHLDRK